MRLEAELGSALGMLMKQGFMLSEVTIECLMKPLSIRRRSLLLCF